MYPWCTERGLTADEWILVLQLVLLAVQAVILRATIKSADRNAAAATAASEQIAKNALELQKAIQRPWIGLDHNIDPTNFTFAVRLVNVGSGSGLVRKIRVWVDGKPFQPGSSILSFWQDVAKALDLPACSLPIARMPSPGGFIAVGANSTVELVSLGFLPNAISRENLLALAHRLAIAIEAESVLGERLSFGDQPISNAQ